MFLTLFSKRFGYCSKYDNDKLIEQSVYFNDKMVYKYREYSDYTMKEYDKKGNLVYEGEYKRIVDDTYAAIYKYGKGKAYLNNHLYFEGNWVKDIAKGDGIVYDEDGNVLHKGYLDNGWLKLDRGYYCLKMNKYYHYFPGSLWSISHFLMGYALLFISLAFHMNPAIESQLRPDTLSILGFIGFLFLLLAISICTPLFVLKSALLCYMLFGLSLISLAYDIGDMLNHSFNYPLFLFLSYICQFILITGLIYFIYFCILLKRFKVYPQDYNISFPLMKGTGVFTICLEILIGIVHLFMIFNYAWKYYHDCSSTFLIIFMIFLFFNSIIYLIIPCLQMAGHRLLRITAWLGGSWSIISFIASIIGYIYVLMNKNRNNVFYFLSSYQNASSILLIVVCTTWILAFLSTSLYTHSDSSHKQLPIIHSSSV